MQRSTSAAPLAPRTYAKAIAALGVAGDSVTLELDGETVKLTHLDKVLWPADESSSLPAYTRRKFASYLLQVAVPLLAHVSDRPLTLIRHPEGITGRRFVQFHYEQPLPRFVETLQIYSEKGGRAE